MSIADLIRSKKKSGKGTPKENIELLRPIVNIFIGDYRRGEKEYLIQFLNERIGSSNKVNYCQVSLNTKEERNEGQIYFLDVSDVKEPSEYSLTEWNLLRNQIKDSQNLPLAVNNFVNFISNEVSTTTYASKGKIRLNFIIQADWLGTSTISTIIQEMKSQFKEYFNNGVHVDIYYLLDQVGYSNEECGEIKKAFNYLSLNLLDELSSNHLVDMVYIMANYTSNDCLEPDSTDEIVRTIGLAMIVKDGASVKGTSTDRDTYADVAFKEEASGFGGNFFSLGNLKLAVDQEAIEYIVYKSIFDDIYQNVESEDVVKNIKSLMEIDKDELERQCNSILEMGVFSEHVLYSMVKTENVNVASFLNDNPIDIIKELYGNNLDYFWTKNASVNKENQEELVDRKVKKINTELRDAYVKNQCSLASVYRIIKDVESTFNQYEREYDAKRADTNKELKNWLNHKAEIPNLQAVSKETGEPRAIYILTGQYFDKLMRIEEAENMYFIVSECHKQLLESVKYYRGQSDTIKQAADELDQMIKELESEDNKLLRGNMRNYYTNVTRNIIDNSREYSNFKYSINNRICTKELMGDSISQEIMNFCEAYILSDEVYENDLSVEMLRRLKNYDRFTTDESVYDIAFDTIMKQRKYYANHTEFGSIFDAVCFLVNPDNAFVKSTNKRMKSLLDQQQLKLFFEDHFDGMDILFMEGCFAKDSLYKYRLYEKSYEILLKKEQENL